MNRSLLYVGCMVAVTALAMACGSSTNVSVNTNSNTNQSNSSLGNSGSTLGNAANSVANTVSNAASSVTGSSDSTFVNNAAVGGMTEVELGKIAATNAASADVKKFGQMMVTDHTAANNELKALAGKKGWTLPTDLDSSHRSTVDELKSKKGADFDKDYVDDMVDDHEQDVSDFESKANNATDPDLKAFAQKTLPVLKKHLEAIKAIQAKMNNSSASANTKKK